MTAARRPAPSATRQHPAAAGRTRPSERPARRDPRQCKEDLDAYVKKIVSSQTPADRQAARTAGMICSRGNLRVRFAGERGASCGTQSGISAARAAQAAGIQAPGLRDVGAAADELGATAGSVRETAAGAAEAVNGAVTEAATGVTESATGAAESVKQA